MVEANLDPKKLEQFGARAVGIVNDACVALMMSVGDRVGLFDAMENRPPSTSEEIATAAGLNERYVREWLGAMVTGDIVEYDASKGSYFLPPEHAAFLTHSAGNNNMALMAQILPCISHVEDNIIDCFRKGGGVPYSAFGRFPDVMRELSAPRFNTLLVSTILPLADGVVASLEKGIDVGEIGCGSGRAANVMARAFPRSRFLGYDLLDDHIATAREEAADWKLDNIRFETRDVGTLEVEERFDMVTAFDAIHDQADPDGVLRIVTRALRPGGRFFMVDTSASRELEKNREHILGPLLYTVSCMHCMTVSLAHGGAGLGAAWGKELACDMLESAGLAVEKVEPLPDDPINSLFLSRKPS